MSSCCAVARPRAVRGRQEDLDGAQFPRSWLVLQCGRSTAAAGRRTTCSDGTRLQPVVLITRAWQQAWADTPLACAARSARGLFLLRRPRAWSRASRSVGRPHPSHPHPSAPAPTYRSVAAHHPAHRRDRSGVRARSRERGALVQRSVPSRPACRPAPPPASSSPRLLRPGGRWVLKGAALLRVCAVGSPVRAGSARPRPARARPTPRQGTVGALSLLGAWGQPACARYAPNSLSCAYTARLAGGTRERVCFARDRSRAASAVGARSCDSHSSGQWQLAVRSGWLCVFVAWLCDIAIK